MQTKSMIVVSLLLFLTGMVPFPAAAGSTLSLQETVPFEEGLRVPDDEDEVPA
jgi:hypothetical protein